MNNSILERQIRAEQIVDDIWNMFYGQNLQVANWHQNGELEPMDNFFASNDWDYRQPKLTNEDDTVADEGTRFVWVFEVMDCQGTKEKPWQFVKYIMAEYDTCWSLVARQMAEMEFAVPIRGSQRRKLTFDEYRLVCICKMHLPHGERVWQSMLRILFTNSLSLTL